MSDNDRIKFVKKFLDKDAVSWANQITESNLSYVEFEWKFLDKYWSKGEQAIIYCKTAKFFYETC